MKKVFSILLLLSLTACYPTQPVAKPTPSSSQKDCNLAECNCGEACACSSECACSCN